LADGKRYGRGRSQRGTAVIETPGLPVDEGLIEGVLLIEMVGEEVADAGAGVVEGVAEGEKVAGGPDGI